MFCRIEKHIQDMELELRSRIYSNMCDTGTVGLHPGKIGLVDRLTISLRK